MRALFNNKYVFDVCGAVQLVWEHPFYPQYYVPVDNILGALQAQEAVDDGSSAFLCTYMSGDRASDRIIRFDKGHLAGLVRFEFGALGRIRVSK